MAKLFTTDGDLKAQRDAAVEEVNRLKDLVDKLNGDANWSRAKATLNASDWWSKTGSGIRPKDGEDYEEFAERVFKTGVVAMLRGL